MQPAYYYPGSTGYPPAGYPPMAPQTGPQEPLQFPGSQQGNYPMSSAPPPSFSGYPSQPPMEVLNFPSMEPATVAGPTSPPYDSRYYASPPGSQNQQPNGGPYYPSTPPLSQGYPSGPASSPASPPYSNNLYPTFPQSPSQQQQQQYQQPSLYPPMTSYPVPPGSGPSYPPYSSVASYPMPPGSGPSYPPPSMPATPYPTAPITSYGAVPPSTAPAADLSCYLSNLSIVDEKSTSVSIASVEASTVAAAKPASKESTINPTEKVTGYV